MKKENVDGFKATVSKPNSGGNDGPFYNGKIEEDVWIPAVLKEIKQSIISYKGNDSPAWSFIYELKDDRYVTDDGDSCIIREKATRKLTPPPYQSKAYGRYQKLTGKEIEPGEDIDIRDLEGTKCKLMISNKQGDNIVFHKIEKVTTKGLNKKSAKEELEAETKKNVKKSKEEVSKTEDEDDDDFNIF